MPEIIFTAVEIEPKIIKIEIIGVRSKEPTPFCTITNIGTEASFSAGTKATANKPKIDNSIAKKLQTKIRIAARLISLTERTSSICWYITDIEGNWKKKYKIAIHKAPRKLGVLLAKTETRPLAIKEIL